MDPGEKFFTESAFGRLQWSQTPEARAGSLTWISDNWILQQRPIVFLDQTLQSLNILSSLRNDPLFKSSAGDIVEVQERFFFSVWPRVPGRQLPYKRDGISLDWRGIENCLPAIKILLEKLHSIPIEKDAFAESNNNIALAAIASQQWVLEGLRSLAMEDILLPVEPVSELAVSHGDLGFQNILIDQGSASFIDWVTVTALPLNADSARLVESILYCLDYRDWEEVLCVSYILSQDLTYDQWVACVLWASVRTFVVSPSFPDGDERFLSNLRAFLAAL